MLMHTIKSYVQLYSLTNAFPWVQDRLVPDVFQNDISKLVKDMEYVKTIAYLDDLLLLKNNSFKEHILKLEMVLARLSTNELLV
jgi:hypothetical protein